MSSTDASRSRYPRQFRLPARWTRKPKKDRQHPPVPRSEQFWACSNCGHAGMSVFIDSCPECQHLRCETCSLETVEIRRRSGEPGFASRTSNTRDLDSTKSTPTTPDTLASSSLEIHISTSSRTQFQVATSLPTGEYDSRPLPPLPVVDANLGATSPEDPNYPIYLSSRASTPASSSTPNSTLSSGTFNYHTVSVNSVTDIDSETTESDEDGQGSSVPNSETGRTGEVLRALESHLISALRRDLPLAARLIPKIHDLVHNADAIGSFMLSGFNGHGNTSEQQNTGSSASQQGSESHSSSLISQNGFPRSSKHSRESGGSEDGEEDSNSKKPKRDPDPSPDDDPSPQGNSIRSPNFACHFHKHNHTKYGAWTEPKYKHCPGLSLTELRRIKYHFKVAHRIAQCNRCCSVFKNQKNLEDHQRTPDSCLIGTSSTPKEGINDSQWEEIELLLSSKKGAQPPHDIGKWFAIWEVLFPGVPKPDTPWNEPSTQSAPQMCNVEKVLSRVKSKLDHDVSEGSLERNDRLYDWLLNVVRQALEAENTAGGMTGAQRSPVIQREECVSPGFMPLVTSNVTQVPLMDRYGQEQYFQPPQGNWNDSTQGFLNSILPTHPRENLQNSPQSPPLPGSAVFGSASDFSDLWPRPDNVSRANPSFDQRTGKPDDFRHSFREGSVDGFLGRDHESESEGPMQLSTETPVHQNGFLEYGFHQNELQLDNDYHMDQDMLTEEEFFATLLELENQLPEARGPWLHKNSGNKVLSQP